MPNEQKIRQIVREEITRSSASSRFQLNTIPQHTHNGIDSPQIKEDSLIQSVSVSGNITFSASDEYTIYLNSSFTPSSIFAYGNITNGTQLYMSIGSANLVRSFYLQPDTDRTVVTGSIEYPFVDPNLETTVPLQSSCYIGAEVISSGANMHSLSSEGHLVNVFFGGDIKARLTVTEFTRSFIKVRTVIDAGWDINLNIVIT